MSHYLKPISPTADAPCNDRGDLIWGGYNMAGWFLLRKCLILWGVDISEFTGINDGAPISAATCVKVADAIEAHLPELDERDRKWLGSHIKRWRTCGGYEKW